MIPNPVKLAQEPMKLIDYTKEKLMRSRHKTTRSCKNRKVSKNRIRNKIARKSRRA